MGNSINKIPPTQSEPTRILAYRQLLTKLFGKAKPQESDLIEPKEETETEHQKFLREVLRKEFPSIEQVEKEARLLKIQESQKQGERNMTRDIDQ